ncbi:hypothetical protein [Stenotrophomonas maltophilia]|uniref:hypothetical protein n=1 Tax=Stenotrophomonas maltophilia TaxID=40324 RepID=UPI0015DFA6EA|nr:hypothetical protein [Stenotrophomonas maltophilia]
MNSIPKNTAPAPQSRVDSLMSAQRQLLDELSQTVIGTREVFHKVLGPERLMGEACKQSEPSPPQAPLVDAIEGNNNLLLSILSDLQSINGRSVL